MDYNTLSTLQYCYGFFQENSSLLLYTHIPAIAISIFFSLFILKNKRDIIGILLISIATVFTLYTALDLAQWIMVESNSFIIGSWALFGSLAGIMFFLLYWFVYRFINESDPSYISFVLWAIAMTPVIFFTPTTWNMDGFDAMNCNAIENPWFTNYYHILGILSMATMAIAYRKFLSQPVADTQHRHASKTVLWSAEIFVFTFILTDFISSYLVGINMIADYGYTQYGIAMMSIFFGFLTYVTVHYRAFNIKLLATQALVYALVVLSSAQFLLADSLASNTLVAITVALSIIFGFMLVRSVKRVDELSQDKSAFLSLASHEVRNPVTAIVGYASLICDGSISAKDTKQTAEKILLLGKRVTGIITQYLDLSKLELGQLQYNMATVDICSIVSGTVDEFKHRAEEKQLTLKSVNECEHAYVEADENKLHEVLGNLVDNSIKYTPAQHHVDVSIKQMESKVCITVSDDGNGFLPETKDKLFHRFTRADHAKSNNGGSGLGLYISKIFIENMHGTLTAESAGIGQGAKFTIELPIVG